MNNLNSILIEGKVSGISITEGRISFDVSVSHKDGTFEVPVFATNALAEGLSKSMVPNFKVRVVGRLCKVDGLTTIHAEHVEIAPRMKNGENV